MKKLLLSITLFAVLFTVACNRPEANYEGVLMTDYGRNGVESFKVVTGAQGPLGPGSELYQVPMWEQTGDANKVEVLTKDGSKFTVDPAYTYKALRLKGPNIVLSYKNYDVSEPETFFDLIELNILNKRVTDAYREEARKYATADLLMNNVSTYESNVETRLKTEFSNKFFHLETLTSGLTPPASMSQAIESRNNSIQEANKVKNQLETSEMLLKKARIDAETNRVKSSGLTREVLQSQWIEAIRNSDNKIVITDGRTPIILGGN